MKLNRCVRDPDLLSSLLQGSLEPTRYIVTLT